jgi:SAM-dependent methyltransferase
MELSADAIDLQLLIFSIHTYYNIILKLLVSNLFSSLINPFATQKMILTLSDDKFKDAIISILSGEKFKLLNVENFFETGFFEWWTYVYSPELSGMLREVVALLEELEVTTSITKPELIGDMVKHTYHGLMPQILRHLLGEYFTPDWLAEYAIENTGYTGKLDETVLDPSCGSGTFLALAIRKKVLSGKDTEFKDLIKKIIHTVVGFDLNPISVIAAKTNYLLALGDLSVLDYPVKIPVYQCDSILTPTVHAKQKEQSAVFTIDTFCGEFTVPALGTRDAIENVLDDISRALKNNFTEAQLLDTVKLRYPDINGDAVISLFVKIKKLTENEENGLWIPILKNSFAPVYSENEFDFVIGNPPWVSWRSMSKSYRELTLPIWWSYDIFNKSGYDKKTTHDDFAMAFVYVSADHYLKENGKLCFIISQTFFKSKKGGEGFRKFEITRDKLHIPLGVSQVIDMVAVNPFPEVTNRTAVMLLEKGVKTCYPLPYVVWTPKSKVGEHDTLLEVRRKITETCLEAVPIAGTQDEKALRTPWLTLPPDEMGICKKALGKSAYRGRKGVEPLGAKGVYLLKEPHYIGKTRLQVCNELSRGRLKEVEERGENCNVIEETFVYPLISGRDIVRYGLKGVSYILMPHENKKGVHNAVTEDTLKVKYTRTYEWLTYFGDVLLDTRRSNSKFFNESLDPFYALDNVGTYTFAAYKVAWREQNKKMVACVVSTKTTEPLKGKLIIPDSKVLFCSLDDEHEAHYLCAVLNSKIVTDVIEGYTIELQRGTDILDTVKIPKFNPDDKLHATLSSLSIQAHKVFADKNSLDTIDKQVNELAFNLLISDI